MPSQAGRARGPARGLTIGLTVAALAALAAPAAAQVVFPGQAVPGGRASSWRAPPASSAYYQAPGYGSQALSAAPAWAQPQFQQVQPGFPSPLPQQPTPGFPSPLQQQPMAAAPQATALQPRPDERQPGQAAVPERAEPAAEAAIPATRAAAVLPGEVLRGAARAVDGGTISLRGSAYRLAGIAAPALGEACPAGPTSWRCGLAARDTLDRLLARGPVSCTTIAQDGAAALAACRIGRDDLASAMVDAGLARALDDVLLGRQREARRDGRGIWTGRPR